MQVPKPRVHTHTHTYIQKFIGILFENAFKAGCESAGESALSIFITWSSMDCFGSRNFSVQFAFGSREHVQDHTNRISFFSSFSVFCCPPSKLVLGEKQGCRTSVCTSLCSITPASSSQEHERQAIGRFIDFSLSHLSARTQCGKCSVSEKTELASWQTSIASSRHWISGGRSNKDLGALVFQFGRTRYTHCTPRKPYRSKRRSLHLYDDAKQREVWPFRLCPRTWCPCFGGRRGWRGGSRGKGEQMCR